MTKKMTLAGAALFVLLFQSFASEPIIVDSGTVCRPLKNTAASVAAGESLVYDDPANPSGAFHGLFLISFKLDKTQYHGSLKVHIYAQKSGDSWRKIAEVTPPEKPASGDWVVSYVWNSRAAAFEWTNPAPFKTSLKLKFKVVEQ